REAPMKHMNRRTILQIVFSSSYFFAMTLIGHAYAGDYFTYQDHDGRLVISNKVPPPGSKIIKKETLPEVTKQEITESQIREASAGFDNRLSNLEQTIGELSQGLHAQGQAIDNLQQDHGDTNIAVGVTQVPTIISKPRQRQIRPSSKFQSRFAQPEIQEL